MLMVFVLFLEMIFFLITFRMVSLYNGSPDQKTVVWGKLTRMKKAFCGGCGAVALTFRFMHACQLCIVSVCMHAF